MLVTARDDATGRALRALLEHHLSAARRGLETAKTMDDVRTLQGEASMCRKLLSYQAEDIILQK